MDRHTHVYLIQHIHICMETGRYPSWVNKNSCKPWSHCASLSLSHTHGEWGLSVGPVMLYPCRGICWQWELSLAMEAYSSARRHHARKWLITVHSNDCRLTAATHVEPEQDEGKMEICAHTSYRRARAFSAFPSFLMTCIFMTHYLWKGKQDWGSSSLRGKSAFFWSNI